MSTKKHALDISFPSGTSELLKQYAWSHNQTVSALINSALLSRLGLTEWPDAPTPTRNFDYNPLRSCIICGKPLPEGKMRYCSDECKRESHRRAAAESFRRNQAVNKQPRRCVICGTLLPDGSKALFCSDVCKRKAREARRKRLSQSQPPED